MDRPRRDNFRLPLCRRPPRLFGAAAGSQALCRLQGLAVGPSFTKVARRLGTVAAVGTVVFGAMYGVTLVAGLRSLASPQQPIGDPLFSILEILIILSMPLMVALMVSVHAWAAPDAKVFSLMAVVFTSLLTVITSSLHFVILTVSHKVAFASLSPLFLSFEWPSVVYALDILAWDVFFPLAVISAALVFRGTSLASFVRLSLLLSGALAAAGLSGLVTGDMRLRIIGVIGYAGVYPCAAVLLAILFHRTRPKTTTTVV